MKKILFVVDENKLGGVSILLEDMIRKMNLKNKHIDILVLHDSGDKLKRLPNEINILYGTKYFDTIDMTISEVLKTKNIKKILNKLILIFDMKTGFIKHKIKRERKKILKENYDIEIAFKDGFTAIFTAFGNSKKKIHWLHYNYGAFNPNAKYKKLFNKLFYSFDNIVSVSEGVKNDFNKIYMMEDKVKVIHNLVDLDKIKKGANSKTLNNKKGIEIISVGRLHPIKGYDRLVEAISKLKKEKLLVNVKFKIYGDGPEQDKIETMIKDKKIEKYISLEGRVDNPYIYMKTADLFVLPSLFESFGLVIIESLTLGVPLLVTEMDITKELVDDGVNGKIVKNSAEGLYEGLKYILLNRNELIQLKKGAETFDYNSENTKILKQLEELLK